MISETERRLIFMSKIKKEHKVLSNFDVELRPHPFEALDYYHEEVLSPIKFKIQDYSVDISEAISNSQIVIATGCQTVLDSIVNKKPVFGNSEGNYNLWDKFILPLDDLSNIEINDGEFNKLADKQFKNALKLGLGEWLNNFLYDFDYSYLIALLNEKHNSKYVIRNFIKIIFYTLKIIKIIPKILKKIFFYSVNKKQRKIKFFGSNDILDAKLRICPKLQAKVLKEKVVLFN